MSHDDEHRQRTCGGLLQCVLVAAVLMLSGASLAFAAMVANARCEPSAPPDRPPESPRGK